MRIKKKFSLMWPYLVLILIAFCILWIRYNSHTFILRGDAIFHINQFYESAMQIKTGHFSWFLSLFGFGQVGRVINAAYGPIFSYIMGGLLLLVGTWSRLQIIMEFGTIVLSSFFMYHLSRYLDLGQVLSLVLGVLYATSYPITAFLNGQAFDGIGNIFIPLVIMVGIRIWHTQRIPIKSLAILLAIISQIHVLTVIVSFLTLMPFLAISVIENKDKMNWLKQIVKSAVWFLALTCDIWGTDLDLFYKNHIIKPYPNFHMTSPSSSLNWVNGTVTSSTNFLIIVLILGIIMTIINWELVTKKLLVIQSLAIVFTFLASKYFPWDFLVHKFPVISQTIQFPDRFLSSAAIFILVVIGMDIHYLYNNPGKIKSLISLVLLLLLAFSAYYSAQVEVNNMRTFTRNWIGKFNIPNGIHRPQINIGTIYTTLNNNKANISKALMYLNYSRNLSLTPNSMIQPIPDYLPSNKSLSPKNYSQINPYYLTMRYLYGYDVQQNRIGRTQNAYGQLIRPRFLPHFRRIVKNHTLIIKWYQPHKLAHKQNALPAVKYYHTMISINHKTYGHLKTNPIGLVLFSPNAGNNQIAIHYQASKLWSLGILITIASWLMILIPKKHIKNNV